MDDIVRNIKLTKVIGGELDELSVKIIEFFDELFEDMIVDIKDNKIKCYKKGYDYYIFDQESENDILWCDYGKVWSFFKNDLKLKYHDIQTIIKYMVEIHLKLKVSIPTSHSTNQRKMVETQLKLKVSIPAVDNYYNGSLVETHLKLKVGIPNNDSTKQKVTPYQ